MKTTISILVITLTGLSLNAQEKVVFATEKDSASYAAGLNEGERMMNMLQESGADTILQQGLFFQGFFDYIKEDPKMDLDAARMVLQSYFGKYQQMLEEKQRQQNEEIQKIYAVNKEKSATFLAENKKKPGVITTESGLQYKIIKKGKGKNIAIGDLIKVHYVGTLTDGTLVDSIPKSEPYELELQEGTLIPGWTEVLQLMKKDSHYTVYIPSDLGYGDMGKEPQVPPFSVLIFDLEIVGHTPKK